jgi:hypothetical protein
VTRRVSERSHTLQAITQEWPPLAIQLAKANLSEGNEQASL